MDPQAADAGTLRILSAGAPKTGVSRCAEAFGKLAGCKIEIEFATAPVVKGRVEAGEDRADVVVATVAAVAGFEAAGRAVPGTRATVGSVKAGVVVRVDTPDPDISSADALRQAILDAPAVVYNAASSGRYIEKMMERLGIAETVRNRTVRPPSGGAVMQYLANEAQTGAIGFGQATEIRLQAEHDGLVRFVGTLPREVENITAYAVAALSHSASPDAARALAAFMGSPDGLAIFAATGVT